MTEQELDNICEQTQYDGDCIQCPIFAEYISGKEEWYMRKDELVVLRFHTKEDLDKALSFLSNKSKREILPKTNTGYYVKISKSSAIKIEKELNKK